jgi:hypothetical protein
VGDVFDRGTARDWFRGDGVGVGGCLFACQTPDLGVAGFVAILDSGCSWVWVWGCGCAVESERVVGDWK